jgi:hypothetical protein
MRLALPASALIALLSTSSFGQEASPEVAAVQKAAVTALNYRQGDAAGLSRARADFTVSGWNDFMLHLKGFLDDKGAPTFTSSFVTARGATILEEKDGAIHFKVPGTLTQSNQVGKTTYGRFAIEVYALREPGEKKLKIQRLEQITCLGDSTACN